MNQELFLQECHESYPEAMAALGFFRQLVRQRCKVVVDKRIGELGEVLGVPRQELRLTEYAFPDKLAAALQDEVGVGWLAKRSENLYLYFYLSWCREPDEGYAPTGVVIFVWIKDRQKREGLAARLHQLVKNPPFDDGLWGFSSSSDGIEFWLDLKEDEVPQLGDKLDELFDYTIAFLKSLEGVASYFQV